MQDYRTIYRDANGTEPPPPYVAGWTFVDESADRAEEMARKYVGGYWDSVVKHYEFNEPHLKEIPGYEHHGLMYDRLVAPGGYQQMEDFFIDLQLWGTPEQVTEKIINLSRRDVHGWLHGRVFLRRNVARRGRAVDAPFRLKGDARTAGSSRSARSAWRAGVRTADATSSTSTSR